MHLEKWKKLNLPKTDMSGSDKKSIYDSGTTKGSAPRTSDRKRYEDNYDKIFRKKEKNEKKDSNR